MRHTPLRTTGLLALALLATGTACHDAGDGGTVPAGGLSLTLAPTSGSVIRGNTVQTAAVASRGDEVGAVTFSVEGAPAGVTGSVGPVETSAQLSSALITLATTTGAATGTSTITIRAHAEGVTDVTRSYTLTITPPATSSAATLDFSSCAATGKPIWLAAQDGSAAFTRVLPLGESYQFNVTSTTGTVAWVTNLTSGGYQLHTATRTRAHWIGAPQVICATPTPNSFTGTLAGVNGGDAASIAFGGTFVSRGANGAFTLAPVRAGTFDLLAFLRGAAGNGTGDRFIIRRGVTSATTAPLGTMDFQGVESGTPVTAAMSMTGLTGVETPSYSMFYYTGTGCNTSFLYTADPVASVNFTASGIPAANQVATDFHELFVSAGDGFGTASRGASRFFHTFGPQSVALPTALPAFSVTSALTGDYRRLQTSFTLPPEYAGTVTFGYSQNNIPVVRSVAMSIETATTAGQTLSIAVPDLSTVSGWDSSWGPSLGVGGNWYLYAYNDPAFCTEGARYIFSQRNGPY